MRTIHNKTTTLILKDMFPMGHVNTLPMLDHHLKRDDIDDGMSILYYN